MLPKRHRLSTEWAVQRTKRRGRRLKTRYLSLAVWRQKRQGPSRFCFITSLKISKKAVERNKLKRRARDVVKRSLAKIKPGYDIAISFYPPAAKLPFRELEREIFNTLNRGHYIERK